MTDREKVLKALEHHKKTAVCNGCPYAEDSDTTEGYCPVYDDAIALLREQEAVEPYDSPPGYYRCGNCGTHVYKYGEQGKYCPRCGRKVKWG